MRLFIALPLEPPVRDYLGRVIEQLRRSRASVKWVNPKNMHLTVRFLGETPEATVPKLTRLMDEIAPQFSGVDVAVDKLGAFPNLRKPRVVWAGLSGDIEPLEKMARQIELAVRKLRFEPEKKGFKPHLTLGRLRDPRNCGDLPEVIERFSIEPTMLRLDRIVLFKSTLTPQGPIYDKLHETLLGERFGGSAKRASGG